MGVQTKKMGVREIISLQLKLMTNVNQKAFWTKLIAHERFSLHN